MNEEKKKTRTRKKTVSFSKETKNENNDEYKNVVSTNITGALNLSVFGRFWPFLAKCKNMKSDLEIRKQVQV